MEEKTGNILNASAWFAFANIFVIFSK
jgi:hypothetical protein